MGRGSFDYIKHNFKYPEYKSKKLGNRRSLIASINGKKGSFRNILDSLVIKEDELEIVNEIISNLDKLSNKVKENDKKDKNKKPVIRFEGTGTIFKGI